PNDTAVEPRATGPLADYETTTTAPPRNAAGHHRLGSQRPSSSKRPLECARNDSSSSGGPSNRRAGDASERGEAGFFGRTPPSRALGEWNRPAGRSLPE